MFSTRHFLTVFLSLFIAIQGLQSQDCTDLEELSNNLSWDFQVSSSSLEPGDTFVIDCFVDGFVDILSFQYTVNYDPSVLEFESINNTDSPLIGVVDGNFTPEQLMTGSIPIIWTNQNGEGQTFSSNSSIFKMVFEVIGDPETCSFLEINGDVVGLEIAFELPNGDICSEILNINYQISEGDLCIKCGEELFINDSYCNGSLSFTVCGGIEPYFYEVEGIALIQSGMLNEGELISFDNLDEANYKIGINDATGVYKTQTINLTTYTPADISGGILCPGESIMLSATEGFPAYTWTDEDGNVIEPIDETRPWEILATEVGLFSVSTNFGDCGDIAQFMLTQSAPQSYTFLDYTACNTSGTGNPTSIDLQELIVYTSNTYSIQDSTGAPLGSTVIDFDGYAEGTVSFLVVIDATATCDAVTAILNVNVIECDCPEIFVFPIDGFCNGQFGDIDFFQYLGTSTSNDGVFSIYDSSGLLSQIQPTNSGLLNIQGYEGGEYTLEYTLDNIAVDCPNSYSTSFIIFASPQPQFIDPEPTCNTDTLGANTTIELTEYVSGVEGEWQSVNGDPLTTTLLDFNGSIAGNYVFYFVTTDAIDECPNITSLFELEVIDCTPSSVGHIEDLKLAMYPNPSTGTFNIELSDKMNIVVYDVAGKIVKKSSLASGINLMEMNPLNKGVYLIEFYSEGLLMDTQKIFIH